MNVIGAFILVVLIVLVLGASRRMALLSMMAGVMFLTQFQSVNVAGLNLFAIRFLELAGFVRVMARSEFSFRQINGLDRVLFWLYGFTTVVFLLRGEEGQANQIGTAVDAFLCYFTFRGLLSNMEEYRWFLRAFVFLLLPYTLLVFMQSRTGHNPFTALGAIDGISGSRNDRPRCDGSFRQPDTLGMFGASFFALYIGFVCIARERKRAVLGICLCLALVVFSNSGGPISGAGVGLLSWGMWCFRTRMRLLRWGIVALIVALALVMKDPVWFIFDRASDITGGDGWHRSYLIDVAYRHIGTWWFAGMPLSDTIDWFPYHLASGTADITDLFIYFGLTAGLGAVVLLILLLIRAFSNLGLALAVVRSGTQQSRDNEFLLWGLGAMMVVHIIDWFGVIYFDQMYVVWFMQLSIISTLSQAYLVNPAAPAVEETVLTREGKTPLSASGFTQQSASHAFPK